MFGPFQQEKFRFFRRIIITDSLPYTGKQEKQQSREWKKAGRSASKKIKTFFQGDGVSILGLQRNIFN